MPVARLIPHLYLLLSRLLEVLTLFPPDKLAKMVFRLVFAYKFNLFIPVFHISMYFCSFFDKCSAHYCEKEVGLRQSFATPHRNLVLFAIIAMEATPPLQWELRRGRVATPHAASLST